MSDVIEEKVVEMRFDNRNFNKNIDKSIESLDRMDEALKLRNGDEGFRNVNKAAKNLNMAPAIAAVETLKNGFSAMEVVAITAISNITSRAMRLGETLVNTFAIAPLKSGFGEYSEQLNSTQVIISNTGDSLQRVTHYLDELNEYADKTIYSFGDMTKAIGKFAAAGVDLEPATNAIKGLSNAAALVGANGTQLYSAYYNLAQSLQVGYLQTIDWNSLANSTIGNSKMRTAFVETAIAMGKFTRESAQAQKAFSDFKGSLSDKWLTSDIIVETLNKYSRAIEDIVYEGGQAVEFLAQIGTDENDMPIMEAFHAIMDESGNVTKYVSEMGTELEAWEAELAITANKAATEIKSFSQMWDTLTEAAGTGWAETWKLIIGDLETAKKFWTELEKPIEEVISLFNDARNAMLEAWADPTIYNGRQNLLDGILALERSFMKFFKVIYYALDRVFPQVEQKLAIICARFKQFSEAISMSADEAEALEDVLVILLQPLKILFKVLGFIVKLGATAILIVTTLFKMVTFIISTIYNLPELLMAIWDWVRQSDPFKVLVSILEVLGATLYTIVSILWRLATVVFKMVLVVGYAVIELFKALGNAVREFIDMVSKSETFMYILNTAVTILKSGFELLVLVIETAINKLTTFFNSLNFSSFTGLVSSGTSAAMDFVNGVVNGITSSSSLAMVRSSAIGLASTLLEAFRGSDGIDAHSPSKKGYKYGEYVPQGVSNGMLAGASYISKAAKALANEALVPLDDVKRQANKNSKKISNSYGKIQDSVYKDGKKTATAYASGLRDANMDIDFGGNLKVASDNVEMQLKDVTASVKDSVDVNELNAAGIETSAAFIDGISDPLINGKYEITSNKAGKEVANDIVDGYNDAIDNSDMTTGNTFINWIKATWKTISEFAVEAGIAIGNFVKRITPGQVALYAFVGSMIWLIASFAQLNHGLGEMFESFGDILHSISARIYAEAFDNITSSLLHLAEAIALVAFTATLNPEGIRTAGIILGGFTVALLGFIFALSRIPAVVSHLKEYIQGIAAISAGSTILLGFAAAVYILARALQTLSNINTDNIGRSLGILASLMLGVSLIIAEIAVIGMYLPVGGVITIALAFIAFAAAIRILVGALDKIVEISESIYDFRNLIGTIVLIGVVFAGLIGLAGQLSQMGRVLAAGMSLLALNLLIAGAAISSIFMAFTMFGKQMAKTDFTDEIQNLMGILAGVIGGVMALSVAMVYILTQFQKAGGKINEVSGVFLSLAAFMTSISLTVFLLATALNQMDTGQMVVVIGILASMMVGAGGLMMIMYMITRTVNEMPQPENVVKAIDSMSKFILTISGAMAILGAETAMLAAVFSRIDNIGAIWSAIGAMVLEMIGITAIIFAMGVVAADAEVSEAKINMIAQAITRLTIGMSLLMLSITAMAGILGGMNINGGYIAAAMATVAVIMVGMYFIIRQLGNIKVDEHVNKLFPTLMGVFLLMTELITATAVFAAVASSVGVGYMLLSLFMVITLMGAIAGVIVQIQKIPTLDKYSVYALITIFAGLGVLFGAIAGITALFRTGWITTLAAVAVVLGSAVAIILVIQRLIKSLQGINKGTLRSLSLMVLSMGALLATIGLMIAGITIAFDNTNNATNIIMGIIVTLASLMLVLMSVAILVNMANGINIANLNGLVYALLSVSVVMGVLTAAIYLISNITDWPTVLSILGGLTLVLMALGGLIAIMSNVTDENVIGMAASLAVAASSLLILASALYLIQNNIEPSRLRETIGALAALAGIMAIMGGVAYGLSQAGQYAAIGIAAILAIAVSCMGMAYALRMLGEVPFETLGDRIRTFSETLFTNGAAANTWQLVGAFAAFVAVATLGGPGLLFTSLLLTSLSLTVGTLSVGISALGLAMSGFVATISNIDISITRFLLPMYALLSVLPFLTIEATMLSASFLVMGAACVLVAASGLMIASVIFTLADGLTRMAVMVSQNAQAFLQFTGIIFLLGLALVPLSVVLPLIAGSIALLGIAFAIAMMPIVALLSTLGNFAEQISNIVDTLIAKIVALSVELSKAIVSMAEALGENTEGIQAAIGLLWSFAGAFASVALASILFGAGLVVCAAGIALVSGALALFNKVLNSVDMEGIIGLFEELWSRGGALAALGAAFIALGAGCLVMGLGLLLAAGGLLAFAAAVDYVMNNAWLSLEEFLNGIIEINKDGSLVGLGFSLIPLSIGLLAISGTLPLVAAGIALMGAASRTLPYEAWEFIDMMSDSNSLAANLVGLGFALFGFAAALSLVPLVATPAALGLMSIITMMGLLAVAMLIGERIADSVSYIITTITDAVWYAGSTIASISELITNSNVTMANSLLVVGNVLIIFTDNIYTSAIIITDTIEIFKMEMVSLSETAPDMLVGIMLIVGGLLALGATALVVSPVALVLEVLLGAMQMFAPGLEAFGNTVTSVIDNVATALEEAADKISNAVNSIKTSLSQVTTSVSSSNVGGMVVEGTSALKDFVSGLTSDPAGAISNVFNEGIALGQALINGLRSKKGIDSHSPSEKAKSAFWDFVAGVATDIKGGKKAISAVGSNLGGSLFGGFKDYISSTKIGSYISGLFGSGEGGNIISKFKDGISAIWSGDFNILDTLGIGDVMSEFENMMSGGNNAFDSMGASAQKTKGTIESLTETIKNQMKIFEKFDDSTDITASDLISNMESQINGITNWANGIETLGARGMSAALIKYLSEMGPQGYKYVEAFLDMTEEEFEYANELYAESLQLPTDAANTIARGYEWAGAEIIASIAGGISNSTPKIDESMNQINDAINDDLEEEAEVVDKNTTDAVDNTLVNAIEQSLATTNDPAQQSVLEHVREALINGWTPDPEELTQAWTICYGEATKNFMASVKAGAGDEAINQLIMGGFSAESIGQWDNAWHNLGTLEQQALENALAGRDYRATFNTSKYNAGNLVQMQQLGRTNAKFLVDGMLYDADEYANMCYQAGSMYAAEIIAGYRTMLDINSPSKVMEKLMGYTLSPIESTLNDTSNIFEASSGYGSAVVDGLTRSISKVTDVFGTDFDDAPVIRPVLDLSNIEAGQAQMDNIFSSQAAMLGAVSFNNMKSSNDPIYDMFKSLSDLNTKNNQDLIDAINRSDKPVTVNVSLEGDAEGVFKLVEDQNLKATKSQGVSPLMTMFGNGIRSGRYVPN